MSQVTRSTNKNIVPLRLRQTEFMMIGVRHPKFNITPERMMTGKMTGIL